MKFLEALHIESHLGFLSILGVVVILMIVLIIIVSFLKVQKYRNCFWDLKNENKNKWKKIEALKEELETYKILNAKNELELKSFEATKKSLEGEQYKTILLQDQLNEREKELSHTQGLLDSKETMYEVLLDETSELKSRIEELFEENSRFRINNSRLLQNLEERR